MPAPDPQTLAARSGLVPQCAKGGKPFVLLLVLFSGCLNPMPEEFPSNDSLVPDIGEPETTTTDEANGPPTLPNPGDSGEILGGDIGTGGSGGNVSPPLTDPPVPVGNGEGEPAAPDAGADAGAPSAEATGTDDTSPEGEATP
jgi:hypothetical protein